MAMVPMCRAALVVVGICSTTQVAAQTSSQPQHRVYGFVGKTGDHLFGTPAGDVNADGYPDLIMNAKNRVEVFSGMAGRRLHSWNIANSLSVAPAGDVNNDGKDDILVYVLTDTVHVYSGADGKILHTVMGTPRDFLGLWSMTGLGDLNGDGHDEFAAGSFDGMQNRGYANVYSGRDAKLMYQVTGKSWGDRFGSVAALGDTNLDKVPDFAVSGERTARVYSGKDGKVIATLPPRFNNMRMWPVRNVGDLNRDGFADLSTGTFHTHFVSGLWVATGKTNAYLGWGLAQTGGFWGGHPMNAQWSVARVGDQNGDGYADVAAIDIRTKAVKLFSGRALTAAGHQAATGRDVLGTVGAGTKWTHVGSADINQDGVMELILSRAWDVKAKLLDGHCEVLSFRKLALATNTHKVSVSNGGTQKLMLDAGSDNPRKNYWVFGSATGTRPGVTLPSPIGSVTLPLVPDIYTNLTIAFANTGPWLKTRGTLDANGKAQASIVVPNVPSAVGVVLYHAYLVYDAKNNFYMASNPTTLLGVK